MFVFKCEMTVYEQDLLNGQTALIPPRTQYDLTPSRVRVNPQINCGQSRTNPEPEATVHSKFDRLRVYVFVHAIGCLLVVFSVPFCRLGMTVCEQDWLNWQTALFPPRAQ